MSQEVQTVVAEGRHVADREHRCAGPAACDPGSGTRHQAVGPTVGRSAQVDMELEGPVAHRPSRRGVDGGLTATDGITFVDNTAVRGNKGLYAGTAHLETRALTDTKTVGRLSYRMVIHLRTYRYKKSPFDRHGRWPMTGRGWVSGEKRRNRRQVTAPAYRRAASQTNVCSRIQTQLAAAKAGA